MKTKTWTTGNMETQGQANRHLNKAQRKTEKIYAHEIRDCQNKTGSGTHAETQTKTHEFDTKMGINKHGKQTQEA